MIWGGEVSRWGLEEKKKQTIVLYYKLYVMGEGDYAVDMDYSISGKDGETDLYDMENIKNTPMIKMNRNPVKNQMVLYYRQGQIKEGEAVAEVYYIYDTGYKIELLRKNYIAGLKVGEPYKCQDETILNKHSGFYFMGRYPCRYRFLEEESRLDIEALSENPKENE